MTGATGSAIPSLAMLTPAEQAQHAPADLLDVEALAADLDKLCKQHAGNERELRTALAQRLKAALLQGRATAEKLLLADRHGRRCAERLCHMQDEIIRLLFELAAQASLSVAEPVGSRADGGGRDRRLRARIAGAGLRHRSVVPAALQADRVGRVGRRDDPLLPVGHGAQGRPRDALDQRMRPAGQGRHHHPHRRARGALSVRRPQAVRRDGRALRQGRGARHRAGIRRRQARRARGAPPPRRPVALSGRAQRQGRQGRAARPAHAVLDREIRLPGARARGADREGRLQPRRIHAVPPLRGFPVVGALPHALPHRPRRGAAVVRHPARDRGAARLHLASRPARRRALHEALLPDREGRRRPDRDPVRRARGQPGQGDAGAQPHDGAVPPVAAALAQRDRGFHRRLQPHH